MMISRLQGFTANLPRFRGEQEYQQYLTMLRGFSDTTISRVAHVKRHDKNEGPYHILLAKAYGWVDGNMHKLNQTIVDLLKNRSQAKKNPDPAALPKAVEILHDLRKAIVTVLSERGYDAQGHPKAKA